MSYRILEEVLNHPANNMQDYGPKNNNFTLEETIIEEELATGDILTALLHLDQVKSRYFLLTFNKLFSCIFLKKKNSQIYRISHLKKILGTNLFQANLLDTRTTTPNLNEGVALHLGASWQAYGV